jgi:hypothetical protein
MFQTGQPLISSQQQLEQLLNVISQRPSGNIIVNAPRGEQGAPGRQGARGFPGSSSEVSLEDIRRGIIPPSERSGVSSWLTPSLESLSPRSLKSFAFDFDNASMKSGQSYVLDQPDAPLISPPESIVSGAPIRLDDPHEDAPVEEKQEHMRVKRPKRGEEQYLSPYEIPPIDEITEQYINSLPNTAEPKSGKITLRQLADAYGITLSRDVRTNKTVVVNAIWQNVTRRRANPNLSSSAPK